MLFRSRTTPDTGKIYRLMRSQREVDDSDLDLRVAINYISVTWFFDFSSFAVVVLPFVEWAMLHEAKILAA